MRALLLVCSIVVAHGAGSGTESANEEENYEVIPSRPRRHCWEIYDLNKQTESGVYYIYPFGVENGTAVKVFCSDGFTVFQQRDNKQKVPENFDRNWNDYKKGFGRAGHEFWLGLDAISALTRAEAMGLAVEFKYNPDYDPLYVYYDRFRVSDESDKYKLRIGSPAYETEFKNYFGYANNARFSTPDRDNSRYRSCSKADQRGGWWFRSGLGFCKKDNLNAPKREDVIWDPRWENGPAVWTRMSLVPRDL